MAGTGVLPFIRGIDLTLNDLEDEKFPEAMEDMTSLRWLKLNKTKLRTIPAELSKLQQLEHLTMKKNQVESISSEIKAKLSGSMVSVFIPTTPNPTTGWYAVVPENEVVNLSMSIEDALKIVVSGGIVAPSTALSPLAMSQEYAVEIPNLEVKRKTMPIEEG